MNNPTTPKIANWKASIPVFGLAFLLASGLTYTFFPGLMSYDSLSQFRQTLGLIGLSDAHPVILVYLWRGLLKIYDHAGVLLAFHQIFYWFGIGLFACLVTQKLWLRLLLLVIIGLCPPLVILSLHLWKDVTMLGALLLASALALGYIHRPHFAWLMAAVLALFFAVAVRINGFIPAFPLLVFLLYWGARKISRSKWKVAALTVSATLGFLVATNLAVSSISSNAQRVYGLGTLLVWDMVSISLEKGEDLLPQYLERKNAEDLLPQLAAANSKEANYPSYAVISPYPPKSQEKQLLKDWLSLVARYPEAYLRHRAHVFAVMLGIGGRPIYYPYHPGIDENELGLKFENVSTDELQRYFSLFDWLARSILYRPWVYMLLGVLVALVSCVRCVRNQGNRQANQLSLAIAMSGILSACSLFFIATAADYRYITWTILAALLSAIVLGAEILQRGEEASRHVGINSPLPG